MDGIVVWLTGLPGSGKSTVAEAVRNRRPDTVILRMDELRKIVTPQPAYSDAERELVYRSLVYAAKIVSELGRNVIIDATGNRRRWRELAREMLPQFAEVYIKCSLDECRKREEERSDTRGAPKDIYHKGDAGWPVPGVAVPYEEPLNPDLVVDTGLISADEAAELTCGLFERLKRSGQ